MPNGEDGQSKTTPPQCPKYFPIFCIAGYLAVEAGYNLQPSDSNIPTAFQQYKGPVVVLEWPDFVSENRELETVAVSCAEGQPVQYCNTPPPESDCPTP